MSSNSTRNATRNQLNIDTDLTKIFIYNNRYASATYTNSSYADVVLVAGTLMGRIGTSQQIVPLVSTAVDGSQIPVGILAEDATVSAGAQVTLTFCNAGDVAEEKVVLGGSDTLSTLVSGRSLRDRIAGDTVGIVLKSGLQMTDYDN